MVGEEPMGSGRRRRPAARIVLDPVNLRRTLVVTAVVGTVLFVINQLDVVMAGNATPATWAKGALTYVVPFLVSSFGVVQGERRWADGAADLADSGC